MLAHSAIIKSGGGENAGLFGKDLHWDEGADDPTVTQPFLWRP
jgi:hypothetical protein